MSIGPIRLRTNAAVKTDDGLTGLLAFTTAEIFHMNLTLKINLTFMGVLGVFCFKHSEFQNCQKLINLPLLSVISFNISSGSSPNIKVWDLAGAIVILLSG